MTNIKQNIKSWLIQWLTILFVLSIGWIGYAAFTTFTALESTSWDTLTATKWNDMVDAVKDEYSTGEILTNKVWIDGKPIYRKVVTCNETVSANQDNYIVVWDNAPTNVDTGIDVNVIGIDWDDTGWMNYTNGTEYRKRVYFDGVHIWTSSNSANITHTAILEYTKQ